MRLINYPRFLSFVVVLFLLSFHTGSTATSAKTQSGIKANFTKSEHLIPMRDGKRLFTVVYSPKDTLQPYPILMQRTPYGSGPYGAESYKGTLGPSPLFTNEGYIFMYQDVRGTFMSEGEFEDVRPFNPHKKSNLDIDEASDTFDTIDWLIKSIPNNNGRVGIYGISYPGFYAATALQDPHPALKAASPQAPIADWFLGDDDHHNGAYFLNESFGFITFFGMPRPQPTPNQFKNFDYGTNDGYKFYLELGSLANVNPRYLKGQSKYWNDVIKHGTYDEFWQSRSVLPYLKKVMPAVLTVGGWFDAEDLYGALHVYQAIEKNNPKTNNNLVMGPWSHGGWARGTGESLGNIRFDVKTAEWFRENAELKFFNFYLKDKGEVKLPEAMVFQTGANEWKSYDQWPPKDAQPRSLYLQANGKLSFDAVPKSSAEFDEYVSDPANPVPYSSQTGINRNAGYMIEDQRFLAQRPDVLSYQTDALKQDVTLAGPMVADLFVSTTGTDADFVVKLIDVYPDDAPNNSPLGEKVKMGGFQMLVRGEVMRGKFRNSFSKPEPFTPGKPAEVKFNLQDINHTFKAGHKIMIQVQSSWFPLVDRNPQKFVDIYNAADSDFQKATHRIFHSARLSSHLKVGVLK
ncbi:MAG: CocE/NonD family hydrolase [Acidobacteria bacterium]|nr:CocE/NonD family hydrolase [Acidobacteriota bacterium]